MKLLNVFSVALLLGGVFQAKSQEITFDKPDSPAKCKKIREGKFLRENYPEGIWYMTIKNNIQTEYFNNGKDYIKSTLVFLDDCNYRAIVLDKSDKSDPVQIGDVFSNKVVETESNFIKINSKVQNEQFELVLIKLENKK